MIERRQDDQEGTRHRGHRHRPSHRLRPGGGTSQLARGRRIRPQTCESSWPCRGWGLGRRYGRCAALLKNHKDLLLAVHRRSWKCHLPGTRESLSRQARNAHKEFWNQPSLREGGCYCRDSAFRPAGFRGVVAGQQFQAMPHVAGQGSRFLCLQCTVSRSVQPQAQQRHPTPRSSRRRSAKGSSVSRVRAVVGGGCVARTHGHICCAYNTPWRLSHCPAWAPVGSRFARFKRQSLSSWSWCDSAWNAQDAPQRKSLGKVNKRTVVQGHDELPWGQKSLGAAARQEQRS